MRENNIVILYPGGGGGGGGGGEEGGWGVEAAVVHEWRVALFRRYCTNLVGP